jgi:predicted transcriptional regulator
MNATTDTTESEVPLSLDERFSALGSVVGKLSKSIDDRDAYIHSLEDKLTELKIHVGLPKTATYDELSAKIKVSQQYLGQYLQFYSSLVDVLGLGEKTDSNAVLRLVRESYDAYNQITAPVTLEQLSNEVGANTKLLKDILKLHSSSTSDETKDDRTQVEEKVANYEINTLLRRPNYATMLGSGLLSGLVCAGIGLLIWYKAPEVHVHQRRVAESEIASTYRPPEIPKSDKISKCLREVKSYISNKLSLISEITKLVPLSQPAAAEATGANVNEATSDTAKLAVENMHAVIPTDVDKTPPKVSLSKINEVTKAKISSKYYTIEINGETEPVTCNITCPNSPFVTKSLDNIMNDYKLPLNTCPLYRNVIYTKVECTDLYGNKSKSVGVKTKLPSTQKGVSPKSNGTKPAVVPDESAAVPIGSSGTTTEVITEPTAITPDKSESEPKTE